MLSTKELSQLKKVYDSLPEFLKYVKMNTPTTSPDLVPAAAEAWINGLDPLTRSDIINRPSRFATYEEHILNEWIQAEVLPWWADQSMEYKDSVKWPEVMGKYYSHCIAVLFLQEKPGYMEYCSKGYPAHVVQLGKLKTQLEEKLAGKEVSDGTLELPGVFANHPRCAKEEDLVPSEKVLSTETVELREMAILRIARKSLMDVNFTAWHVANESANWQKLQDKELIQSLLDALKNVNSALLNIFIDSKHWIETKEANSAITKAQEYLGTK